MNNQSQNTVEEPILRDFKQFNIPEEQYADNYEYDRSCLTRHTIFIHTFDQARQIRHRLSEIDQSQEKRVLNYKDVPSLQYEDSSAHLGKIAWQMLAEKIAKKEKITILDIYKCLILSNGKLLFTTVLSFIVQNVFRVFQSLLLYYLFESVRLGEKQNAYLFALGSGLCLLGQNVGFHNGFLKSSLLNCRMRGVMIFMIYHKLSTLSHFTIKNASVGKITNMLSNDFNIVELKIPLLTSSIPIPIGIIGITVLLCLRLGWTGLIVLLVIIILTPLQLFVGKLNGVFLTSANVNKDARVKLTTQIIEGIKFIKLYGWEMAFKRILQNIRTVESESYLKLGFGRGVERTLGNVIAFWGGFVALISTYYIDPQRLNSAVIFSVLELIIGLRLLIFLLSLGGNFLFELNVIFQRLSELFNLENISAVQIDQQTKQPKKKAKNNSKNDTNANLQPSSFNLMDITNKKIDIDNQEDQTIQNGQAILSNFIGYWSLSNLNDPTLKNINIHFKKGLLYGIGGKIGSGKSGLLGVLLSEIPYYSGRFQIQGKISYVEQQPIVFSDSIKNNILFEKEMDIDRYNQCLQASCLESDLQILQQGDETVVGQKGMTLSGGQKARLSLARALYADADIYLLDDPLSAVDSKVAKKIFENCIRGFLKGKTIVLCTHQVHYLEQCDQVAIMDNGQIIHQGTPKKLTKQIKDLMLIEHIEEQKQQQEPQLQEQQENPNKLVLPQMKQRKYSQALSAITQKSNAKKLSITKKQQDAIVSLWTYPKYLFVNKFNIIIFPITIIVFIINEGWNILYYRFLANFDIENNISNGNKYFNGMEMFWGIIGTMLFLYTLNQIVKYGLLAFVVINSNTSLHERMIQGMVRSPASYFDITPSGILINKFSNDIGILDILLMFVMIDVTEGPIIAIILLVNVFQVNPFFIPFGIINIIILIGLYLYFKRAIIQSKQLDLRTKSPVFNALGELISGVIPINIYGRRISSLRNFAKAVDNSMRCSLAFWYLNRGFGSSLSYSTRIIMIIGFLLGVYYSTQETAGLYGASVVFLLQVSDYIQWFSRQQITMQSMLVSVERAFLTINLQPEKQLRTDYDDQIGVKQLQQSTEVWPQRPSFKLENLRMKYQQYLPEVLKGVNFSIEPGKKVGIVGRTGAGKSSIIQALLRIYQPSQNSIYEVGGYNAMKMGLHTLRQNISVIPQTPFLFKGTVRQNLDPFQTNTDENLWAILQQSGLLEHVQGLPNKLDTDVSNSSETFSVGQKQLLCLARALLRKRKILFLDEATSNVDLRTDDLIQKILKEKFTDTTVITIAHRLNTIADYDQIIVMSRGRVKEVGTPYQLIEKKGSFAEMVQHTGKNAQIIKNIARQSYFKKKKRAQRKLQPIRINVS